MEGKFEMKKIYLVFSEEKDGKYYAHAETIQENENLKFYIDKYKLSNTIRICRSKTQAARLEAKWNRLFRKNKIYMY